jgi:nucleoside-diphosphate-sugar epimerase
LGHDVETNIRYLHSERHDLVIHLAAVTHIRLEFDHKLIESNILLTNEIFKTPTRVLYASSCSAAFLTNPYAYTKIWSEYCGLRHGNSLGLRFHNVYGAMNGKGIIWYLLQQPNGANLTIRGMELIRDYIYVEDVVDEIIKQMNPVKILSEEKESGRMVNPTVTKNVGVIDVGTGIGTSTRDGLTHESIR